MKSLFRLSSLAYLLVISFVFVACSGDDEDDMAEPQDPFLGAWIITDAEGSFADDNIGTTYTFSENGSLVIEKGILRSTGTYTRNTSTIEVNIEGGFEVVYDYTLTNTQLTLDSQGSDQKFIFERP
ncbi:MAG: lipocalin family protein [Cyclobacteriaceae bacterium]|mgnify:CR=1 FL=1